MNSDNPKHLFIFFSSQSEEFYKRNKGSVNCCIPSSITLAHDLDLKIQLGHSLIMGNMCVKFAQNLLQCIWFSLVTFTRLSPLLPIATLTIDLEHQWVNLLLFSDVCAKFDEDVLMICLYCRLSIRCDTHRWTEPQFTTMNANSSQ